MRICYVAGGDSFHTPRWLNYFAKRGHEVHLICWRVMPGYNNSIHIHMLTKLAPKIWALSQYISFLLWIIQVRQLVKKIKPDVVHAQGVTHYGFLSACSGFHPLVVTPMGSDVLVYPKQNFFLRALTKYPLKKTDMVTCDGENSKQAIIELGTLPQKINLLCFGTDTEKFNPARRSEKLRGRLGIADSPTMISLRGLEPIYDIDSLIMAIPAVLEQIPEAKFIIAHRGSREVKLKELAKSLGVSQSVKFVGLIPTEEIPQYLASSDVYVSTSLSDSGLAASTAEAMACGLPAIITDFGDNRKWVEDGVNGFIVPLKDPKTLAEKIIYLLGNEAIRVEFGERNRKIIEERNNYYKEMEKMDNIYKDLIGRYKS